ncbi:hypothetical protein [Caulobacter sp. S45]|uniref:hypothetical protein n=1 Tax=Caulobacter sp. S45 TaxID=1641861 RepID=UPI00131C88A6|nr:hypothetical protein [Caulobacter sp. S45]
MPRWVLAILAAFALCLSPLTAFAAQARCAQMPMAAAMSKTAPSPASGAHGKGCCDHPTKACIAACAAMASSVIALPYDASPKILIGVPVVRGFVAFTELAGRIPAKVERPPKSIA